MNLFSRSIFQPAFWRRPGGYEALTYNYFLMKFATSMVDVFGVVWLFTLGDTLKSGVWMVIWYIGVQRVVMLLSLLPVGKVVEKIGYRRSMLIATILVVVKLYIFTLVHAGRLWPLLPALILGGLFVPFYYLAYHGLFIDDNDEQHMGQQIGTLDMLARLATVVSPLAAGLIIERFGFDVLFGVGSILTLLSVVPLMFMPHHKHMAGAVSWAAVWKEIRLRKRFTRALSWWQVEKGILDYYWPVYAFLVLGSYSAFGSMYSLVMLVSGVALYVAGRLYDARPLRHGYPAFVMTQALLWWLKVLSATPLSVVTADALSRLVAPFWWMKVRRYELGKGEKMEGVVYGIAHELVLTVGKLAGLVTGAVLLVWSGYDWMVLAVPAMLGVVVSGYLVREK